MSAFSLRRRLAAASAAAALIGVALPVASAATAVADPRPGVIALVKVPAYGGLVYTGVHLSRGAVYLGGSGMIRVDGVWYGPTGGGSCVGGLAPSLPCNSLIGSIGSGPAFEIGTGTYRPVFHSGHLILAANTPTGASTWGSFRTSVVGLP